MSDAKAAWTDARRAEAQAKPLRDLAAENERLREAHALAFRWIAKQPEGRSPSEATCAYVPADVYCRIAAAVQEEQG